MCSSHGNFDLSDCSPSKSHSVPIKSCCPVLPVFTILKYSIPASTAFHKRQFICQYNFHFWLVNIKARSSDTLKWVWTIESGRLTSPCHRANRTVDQLLTRGIQEHSSQQKESFDMYNEHPVHSQSDDYLQTESQVAERLRWKDRLAETPRILMRFMCSGRMKAGTYRHQIRLISKAMTLRWFCGSLARRYNRHPFPWASSHSEGHQQVRLASWRSQLWLISAIIRDVLYMSESKGDTSTDLHRHQILWNEPFSIIMKTTCITC